MYTSRLFSSKINVLKRNTSNGTTQYCLNAVRQYDYENFISLLLLNKSLINPAITIRAFNVEMARVQDHASDEKIALMRFQFWLDGLDKIFDGKSTNIPAHPIAQDIYRLRQQYPVTKRNLLRLVNSRRNNFSKKYFNSLEEMEKYAEESVSPIYYALFECAGIKDVHADHAASHLGKAQGLTNMLRSVEISAKNRVVLLPQDLLLKHNVSQENVLRCKFDENMKEVVYDVASRANQHIEKARNIKVPDEAKLILLPSVAVDSYLTRLQKKDFLLFDKDLTTRNSLLPFLLYWNKFRSKY